MKAKKAKKRAKRSALKTVGVTITLAAEHRAYVEEIASYACTSIDLVCAVMMATGIFQAKRYKPPEGHKQELARLGEQLGQSLAENMRLNGLLCSCRQIMEANDPGNALTIFGPPAEAPPPAPEGT